MRILKVSERKVVSYHRSAGSHQRSHSGSYDFFRYSPECSDKFESSENLESSECSDKFESSTNKGLGLNNRTKGFLSGKARSRLKEAVSKLVGAYTIGRFGENWGLYKSQISLTFVTLTLSAEQAHDDLMIKREIFGRFLEWLRVEAKVSAFVWRAEKQRNGNIHFHVLCNRRVRWQAVRSAWNGFQERLGYVSRYREKFSRMSLADYLRFRGVRGVRGVERAIKAYNQGVLDNWSNPNSSDIHAISRMGNVEAYISKYMSKGEDEEDLPVQGHLWGRADSVEKMSVCLVMSSPEIERKLRSQVEAESGAILEEEWFTIYSLHLTTIFDISWDLSRALLITCQSNFCLAEGLAYIPQEIFI